ncbi:MAG: hypothetical protein JXA30_12280, partial [Deltaproteobacteria bacterium]|nr:hypothetical protein [Deltaproteobacteria bacterium]
IEPLALECIRHSCACSGKNPVGCLPAEVSWRLRNHCWPGNIRELENVIENALLMSGGCPIELEHLSIANNDTKSGVFPIGSEQRARLERVLKDDSINQMASFTIQSVESGLPLADRLNHEVIDLERKIIIETLQRCAGNQTRAAKMLGISRHTLIKRLNEYKIECGRRNKTSLGLASK